MERTEPSLVPEWLKSAGANGNGNLNHHVQTASHLDENITSFPTRQRHLYGAFGDHDSSRQAVPSDRTSYLSSRKTGEKDSYKHTRGHFNFGRSSSYRSFEGQDHEKDGPRRHWDWDRDRDRTLSAAGIDDRERSDGLSSPWSSAGSSVRYEVDFALRRSQSMGLPNRNLENDKKIFGDGGGVAPPSLATSVSISSSIQKAAFERNFPSLGSQERLTALQMSGGSPLLSSPRLPRQTVFSKSDFSRASSPGSTSSGSTFSVSASAVSGVNLLEGGSSGSVAVSNSTSSNLPSNGVSASIATGAVDASMQMQAQSSVTLPKMVEALVQNPPRVRSPPQGLSETQRLEELAFRQSRQLIPMKPSLPKTMGSRDKLKPKLMRNLDVSASNLSKINQSTSSPQPAGSSYRPSFSPRPEVLKVGQGNAQGKLLVLKTNKEVTSSVSSPKPDVGPSASTVSASNSVSTGVASAVPLSPTMGVLSRKQKQLLDCRVIHATQLGTNVGLDGGNSARFRESNAVEDKRALMQAQNRSDFFNALRKKAASNPTTSENVEKAILHDGVIERGHCADENDKFLTDGLVDDNDVVDKGFQGNGITNSCISDGSSKRSAAIPNGLFVDVSETLDDSSVPDSGIIGTSEEEEAAFLRSLGWEEGADEVELTEEEINAFYQERNRSTARLPSLKHYNCEALKRPTVGLHVGSFGSVSSGLSSSSDSDDEPHT